MSGPEKPARMKATAVRDGGSFKHTIQVRDHTLTVGVNNGSGTFSGAITNNVTTNAYGGFAGGNFSLVKNGSGINSVADLKGKKIAMPFNSTTHFHTMVALEQASIEEMQRLDVDPAAPVGAGGEAAMRAAEHG